MEWQQIDTAPECVWLRTKREGETGENLCFVRTWPDGEREWVDRTGRTTITHGSFAPPTHWQYPAAPAQKEPT